MDKVELVVLDIGGTVAKDHGEVTTALHAALSEHGAQVSAEDIGRLRGASKREMIAALLTKQGGGRISNGPEVDAVYDRFQSLLAEAYRSGNDREIKGAHAAITWLRTRGIAVAANTGFSRHITDLVLSQAKLNGLFDAVVTGEDVPKGRPAPFLIFRAMERTGVMSVHRVIAVGDTAFDLQAGRNAGVAEVVGVLTGACSSGELMKHTPTRIISSVAALPELVESCLLSTDPIATTVRSGSL